MEKGSLLKIVNGEKWKVVKRSEAADVIRDVHVYATVHGGRDKVIFAIKKSRFFGITKEQVKTVLKNCSVCAKVNPLNVPLPLKPISILRAGQRHQLDLIDFRSSPSGGYSWVLSLMDCFTKFAWAAPFTNKRAGTVIIF